MGIRGKNRKHLGHGWVSVGLLVLYTVDIQHALSVLASEDCQTTLSIYVDPCHPDNRQRATLLVACQLDGQALHHLTRRIRHFASLRSAYAETLCAIIKNIMLNSLSR